MPFIAEDQTPDARLPMGLQTPTEQPSPGLGETLGAAFRQGNTLGTLAYAMERSSFAPELGHNPLDVIKGQRYEYDYLDRFAGSQSTAETRSIMAQIDKEEGDHRTIAASGWAGYIALMGMGVLDVTNVLPGGAIYRNIKGGVAVGRTALSAAAAGAVQGVVSEAIMSGTQLTRTGDEALLNISTSTLLSGLLGGGASALLSRSERKMLEVAFDGDRVKLGDAPEAGLAPAPASPRLPQKGIIPEGESRYVDLGGQRYIARADGHDFLGEIPADVATHIGLSAGPIRLAEGVHNVDMPHGNFGELHIEARRGQQIREAGYPDAAHFVHDVLSDYSAIYRAGTREKQAERLILRRNKDSADVVVIGPRAPDAAGESQWDVITAGRFNLRYLNNKELLWERVRGADAHPPEGGSPFDARGQSPDNITSEVGAGNLFGANSVGAAVADTRVAKPESYLLDKVPGVGKAVERMSPVLRTMQSEFTSARRAVLDLAETALATVDNARGVPTTRGPSAEREIKNAQRQTIVALDDVMDDAWKRYRFGSTEAAPTGARLRDAVGEVAGRTGEKLSFTQFDDEVGKAMRRGDRHEIPEVAEVARWVRANVFEPWKARAIKLGMLPEDVDVKTAESYFTRSYNREKITARMSDFVKRSGDWLETEQTRKFEIQERIRTLDEERRAVQSEAAKLDAKLERTEERIKTLEIREKERGMEAAQTKDRMAELDEKLTNQEAEIVELAETVSTLRSQIKDPEIRARIDGLEREVADLQRQERRSRMTPEALEKAERKELKERFLATDDDKALADMVIGRRKPPKESNFAAYIVKEGGVLDTGGDLRAALGGNNAFPAMLNRQGRSLDEWGEKLWNEFPGWFMERPSPDDVLTFIESAVGGRQPPWFLEARLSPDDARLIEIGTIAEDTRAEMARLGYALDDRIEVARFLADHTDNVPAGPERFDGVPPVPGSVLAESVEGALARERDAIARTRDALTAARLRTERVGGAASRNRARFSEAGRAADRNARRLEMLAEQRAVAERKRDLLQEAMKIADENEGAVFARIEAELEGWGGNSAKQALGAVRARNAVVEGRDPSLGRLKSADADVLSAVRRILGSDRELSRMELEGRAREIADRIISSPDGRLPYGDGATGGGGGVPAGRDAPRGALAQREFMIPDEMIEEFLDDSAAHAARKFMHTTVPDIVLSERFGDFNLTELMRKINDEAQSLANGADEARSKDIFEKRDAAINDLMAMRDRLRGTFALSGPTGSRNAARFGSAVRAYNMMTDLGGAALSSIPDMAGAVFRWGFGTVLRDAYTPFIKGLAGAGEGWKLAKEQYRAMGIAAEMANATRSRAINDIAPDYRPQSRLERTLAAGAEASQVLNLQGPWTDFTKTVASVVSGNEIFRAAKAVTDGTATPKQIKDLASSGIDAHMAKRIWKEFQTGGDIVDGVHLPNTGDWKDKGARLAFEGAVGREADIVVVTPGQEKPLWLSDPVVGLIGQHKSFIFGASERLMLANLQRRDANTLAGLITAISGGMIASALYSLASGKEMPKRPQDWVKEGISRSGVLGWFDEVNAIAAKSSRGALDMYRMIGADKPLNRFSSQTVLSQLMGPSAGKIETITKTTGAAFGEEGWAGKDTANARRLVPFQNLFYLRRLLNQVEDAGNELFGVDPMVRH